MDTQDLYQLRQAFNSSRILLCFNGPISRSLIEEIGLALKNYLEADHAQPSAAMDVFGIYIELSQNIRHYAKQQGYEDQLASATVVIARNELGHYEVIAGNIVQACDGEHLLQKINALARLDRTELKAMYKAQLRQPRDPQALSGAGLGLIDVARKSCSPLRASLSPLADGRAFFSLRAEI